MGKRKKGKGKKKGSRKRSQVSSPPAAKPAESSPKADASSTKKTGGASDDKPASIPEAKASLSNADALGEETKKEPPPPPPGLAGTIFRLDALLGKIELVFATLFVIALTNVAVYQFAVVTILKGRVTWADEMIRFLVFFTAMSAAAVAAQQRRMMAIDVLPRLISARARTALRVVLALFAVVACVLLAYAGWLNRVSELLKNQQTHIIAIPDAMLALPIGATLIGLHFLFQAFIDGSYLVRGTLPPEPEAAVH